jgi:hypothetical protein
MLIYRDWLLSGEDQYLRKMWKFVQQTFAYAWSRWDTKQRGVLKGQQHNTYDVEFYGVNPLTQIIYLGALRAAQQMADQLGHTRESRQFATIFEKGTRWTAKHLFNGSYFVQQQAPARKAFQIGDGCLSDQLLGQWHAHLLDLGYLLPPHQVKRSLRSIFNYNFRQSLARHLNGQRIYALGSEGGLLLATWPKGNRPAQPFFYCDEVWTGVEYQAASLMIKEGLHQQAAMILKSVRQRYDGSLRNPFAEVECGSYYARALSSWALLLFSSNFFYHARKQLLRFGPSDAAAASQLFRCFFSTGRAWGVLGLKKLPEQLICHVALLYGQLTLSQLQLAGINTACDYRQLLQARLNRKNLIRTTTLKVRQQKDTLTCLFLPPVTITEGQRLVLTLRGTC